MISFASSGFLISEIAENNMNPQNIMVVIQKMIFTFFIVLFLGIKNQLEMFLISTKGAT